MYIRLISKLNAIQLLISSIPTGPSRAVQEVGGGVNKKARKGPGLHECINDGASKSHVSKLLMGLFFQNSVIVALQKASTCFWRWTCSVCNCGGHL